MGQKRGCQSDFQDPLANYFPRYFHSSMKKQTSKKKTTTDEAVPSLPPVALGLRAAEDSAGFLGTFGTLKAAWADEERYPSTLSSSSKLRSAGRRAEHSVSHQSIITAARWRSVKVLKVQRVNGVNESEMITDILSFYKWSNKYSQSARRQMHKCHRGSSDILLPGHLESDESTSGVGHSGL